MCQLFLLPEKDVGCDRFTEFGNTTQEVSPSGLKFHYYALMNHPELLDICCNTVKVNVDLIQFMEMYKYCLFHFSNLSKSNIMHNLLSQVSDI